MEGTPQTHPPPRPPRCAAEEVSGSQPQLSAAFGVEEPPQPQQEPRAEPESRAHTRAQARVHSTLMHRPRHRFSSTDPATDSPAFPQRSYRSALSRLLRPADRFLLLLGS
eukprot:3331412-Rhodomonas_salina.4